MVGKRNGPMLSYRVLDLCDEKGIYCGRILADLGADVIKVEKPGGDPSRDIGPFFGDTSDRQKNLFWLAYNANKRSITLDIGRTEGKEIFKRLVRKADVVLESFPPGYMKGLGLGYEDLLKVNSRLVMTSISPFGQSGPYRDFKASDLTLWCLGGMAYVSGDPDRAPVQVSFPQSYLLGAAAAAILTALIHRRRTGKGIHIDISQFEAALNFISPVLLDYTVTHRVTMRNGNRCATSSPHGVYRCRGEDRWCAIAIFSDEEWKELCRIIDKPELATVPQFASFQQRKENEDEIDRLISEWTAERPAEEVMRVLQEVGIASGVAQTGKDLLENDPQLAHRRFFRELEHKEIGRHHYEAPPYRLYKTPCELTMPGPCMGEHNEHVCKEILGFSDKEYNELVADRVLR